MSHKLNWVGTACEKAWTGIAALTFVAAAPSLDLVPSAFADDLLIIRPGPI